MKLLPIITLGAALLTGACATGPKFRSLSSFTPHEQQMAWGCFARSTTAGAAVYNPNIFMMAALKKQTEERVYAACMLSQGISPFLGGRNRLAR